jgi:hypothetical protein
LIRLYLEYVLGYMVAIRQADLGGLEAVRCLGALATWAMSALSQKCRQCLLEIADCVEALERKVSDRIA